MNGLFKVSLRLKTLLLSAVFLVGSGVVACTPPDELDATDLEPTLEWDDLTGTPGDEAIPMGDDDARVRLNSEIIGSLPDSLRDAPHLARIALRQPLEQATPYHGGIYGLMGAAKFFGAPRSLIKDDARLYWVMVRVLSEKYGCFMTAKYNYKNMTRVTCRDRRQVVFWRGGGRDWIQFLARQYDDAGYEIVVKARKIIRISDERVI